jgi:hypothetical protein
MLVDETGEKNCKALWRGKLCNYIPYHISMHFICMFSHKTADYEVYQSICIRGYQHILILLHNINLQYGQNSIQKILNMKIEGNVKNGD